MIVRATKNDVGALLTLETVCFAEAWSEKSLLKLLDNPAYLTLLERIATQEPLAYLIGWQTGEDAELARIGVASPARGQGRARQILDAALLIWRTAGVQNVWLEVRMSNAAALGLYQSRGFATVGKRPQYYADGEDAFVLCLKFND
ncbi:ribosomal-protein-alanine N-acetyltransferase [Abditibacterium utsteinense]|uniref:Ribosomal-protein-alanine N-acetyltransferase n=1 Tax=Abditibacterium utsteinense TaxID=1960156 RepID=A0A2S8SX57_9BACT|nr:GNAT family N-acetyltransferase [Abditibacterium utsteinense]PQV65376.1 ribosomal-protein-alanine N-acetyltransferase [Abditibacterium utsteinense]